VVEHRGHEQAAARALGAVVEHDRRELVAGSAHCGNATFVDVDAGGDETIDVVGGEAGRTVREQRHVGAPCRQQQRTVHPGRRFAVEDAEWSVAHFPVVAERAVEHRSAHRCVRPGRSGSR